jgi:hypothetical protein
MKRFKSMLALATMLGTATTLAASAQAMPVSGQLGADAVNLNAIEKTQFMFGGRNYCFYVDGWHGPGRYWCGYAYRRGFGWGAARVAWLAWRRSRSRWWCWLWSWWPAWRPWSAWRRTPALNIVFQSIQAASVGGLVIVWQHHF